MQMEELVSSATPESADAEQVLKLSLSEAQVVARSYDTKSQIVGVGYLFALGVVGRFDANMPTTGDQNIITVLAFWFIVILPVLLFGYVLHPTRATAPDLEKGYDERPERVLYVEPGTYKTVAELSNVAKQTNLVNELCYETLKISDLRDKKRQRFIRGLRAAAISFAVIFASQVFKFY